MFRVPQCLSPIRSHSTAKSPSRRRFFTVLVSISTLLAAAPAIAGPGDVVLYPSDVTVMRGNWTRQSSTTGAGGQKMVSQDYGWSTASTAIASPNDYFEATFSANASTNYRVWLRLRAASNVQQNDSVWVQFSDSLNGSGAAAFRTGTTSAMLMALETCNGCGVYEWGWRGGAWWTSENNIVRFPTTGSHTVRVQLREDGVQVDQIVLSPATYYSSAPGGTKNDGTIVPKSSTTSSTTTTTTARAIPGTIETEDFDSGGQGVAYWDATSGNSGGRYRSTDVDIEGASEGGHDVGWTSAGEWLKYTVNVATAGTYTLQARVASSGNGGSFHVEFNGADKTGPVWVPNTGGWQTWQTISKTVTLSAGQQVMRLKFDSVGNTGAIGNVSYLRVSQGSTTSTSTSSGPFGGRAWAIPGTVQAEDFDNGGLGAVYGDTTAGNSGGAYRTTDVDIERASDGYDIGWVAPGEWLNYTVSVASSGTYTVNVRVASGGGGGTFHVEFGGANKTGSMTVPNTGGWQSWQTVSKVVSLSAGVQSMRLVFDSTGSSGAVGNFNYVKVDAGSTATSSPTTSTTSSGRVRVMTWNIQQGKTAGGAYDPRGQASVMANSGADVILLQEVSTWGEYMPNTYRDLMQSITGRTWYYVFGPSCTSGGCLGTLILSKYPLSSPATNILLGTGVAKATLTVGSVAVDFANVHLEYYDTGKRTSQLYAFMDWTRQFGGPIIAGGDFNSWWGEWWIRQMETEYSDTWQDVTGSDENGYTRGNVRFDYLFRSYAGRDRLRPTACWVISTDRSDHRPVVADYQAY